MGEGDTGSGASRMGGERGGYVWLKLKLSLTILRECFRDAFTKREKGNEDYYIKQQERDK